MPTRFKMALIQMSVTGGNQARNLARAQEMIAEAAGHGSRLVVLPETLDLGWTHPSRQTDAEPIPDGKPYRRLAQAAALRKLASGEALPGRAWPAAPGAFPPRPFRCATRGSPKLIP